MVYSPESPVRITLFNPKGGVGKTTLTANIAFALAEMGRSVLLVDSDPQCNLTASLLPDEQIDDLLNQSNGSDGQTIWTAVSPVVHDTSVGRLVEPISVESNVKLLPGDIRLFEFEELLHDFWKDSLKRRLGALRATASISMLVSQIHRQSPLDYVFYDTGPNIGALNRVLLLDSDFFVVPVTCDLYSVRALATLGKALAKWIFDAETIAAIAPADAELLRSTPAFLGYIPQRFKVYGRSMAAERRFYLREVKNRIHTDISKVLREFSHNLAPPPSVDPILGRFEDMAPLVLAAQREGVAIWESSGGTPSLRATARRTFHGIARRIEQAAHGAGKRALSGPAQGTGADDIRMSALGC